MNVVIAEDDPISRKVLETTLRKWGYGVVVTCHGQEAIEALKAPDAPRLAILDWMMPKMDGPSVCQALRNMEGGEYYYLILLTAKGTKEDTVSGLESGADDYVIKPFNMRELQVRVRCGERIVKLQSELLTAQEALRIQANHDALTGLMNRAAIYEALERERGRLQREGGYLSAATEAAERIRLVLADHQVDIGARMLNVTASLGVASTVVTSGGVSMDELVQAADEALYRAKEGGRNCVEAAKDVLSLY